ncbi:MAG: RNA-binding S4 domain-containing protein [Firmicutes bacterium]|nr:RNA-binding S4 domain-containing protein [Bacillota bacterium]
MVVRPGTQLDQLLKFSGLVSTGGEAKIKIQNGEVKVNNRIEKRRSYKLKEGDVVTIDGVSLEVKIK